MKQSVSVLDIQWHFEHMFTSSCNTTSCTFIKIKPLQGYQKRDSKKLTSKHRSMFKMRASLCTDWHYTTPDRRKYGSHPDNEIDRDSDPGGPGLKYRSHPSGEMWLLQGQIWFYLWLLITQLFLGAGFCTDGNHKATLPVGRWLSICAVCLVVINLDGWESTLWLEVADYRPGACLGASFVGACGNMCQCSCAPFIFRYK